MSSAVLKVEKHEGIATVTLNRPEALNALSSELRKALTQTFRDLQADDSVRVVILTGAGRAFCAGFDLKEMASGAPETSAESIGSDMQEAVDAFDRPIIAAVNGHAITGGFELALACDVRIASSSARFADTHIRVGLLPGWGLSQKLPRIIGAGRAKELSFTGNWIDAERAEAWGLVNRVVPPEQLLPTCCALAADMASSGLEALRAYKRLIDEGLCLPLDEALRHETAVAVAATRNTTRSQMAQRRSAVQERGRRQDRG